MTIASLTSMHERAQVAIVVELAFVDDNHARTERDHVIHVMAGQKNGRVVTLVVGADEVADGGLHRYVEPDGRLVEKLEPPLVYERGHQLALHALPQRA